MIFCKVHQTLPVFLPCRVCAPEERGVKDGKYLLDLGEEGEELQSSVSRFSLTSKEIIGL